MIQKHLAASLLITFSFLGCTASTTPPAATDEQSVETTASDLSENTVTKSPEIDPAKVATKSPQEHIELIENTIEKAMESQSIDGLNESIKLAGTAVTEHPNDEKLLQTKAVLLFQSLQVEPKNPNVTERRFEMGRIARKLLAMHKDDTSKLGEMPNVLLFEESKAHLKMADTAKAWSTLKEARDIGFDQPRVLYLDPAFEPFAEVPEYDTEMRDWVKGEVAGLMSESESFPFVFNLKSFNGENEEGGEPKEVSLADFKGKPVVVDLWGTWCPPCRAALPHLVELHEKHKGELVVLGINFEGRVGAKTYGEAKKVFDNFVEKEPLPYTCLYGQPALTEQLPEFQGFPTMIFVDRTGEVRLAQTGYTPAPVLEAIVDSLMAIK